MKQPQLAFERQQPLEMVQDPFDNKSFVFFDDQSVCDYKIYNDGGHFIGTLLKPTKKVRRERKGKDDLDRFFDEIYVQAKKEGLNKAELFNYLKTQIIEEFGEVKNLDNYITKRIKAKIHNYFARLKRFKRKANLNHWNYFVTITYDDKKVSEQGFKNKLRRCLSNFHTRRNWKYMGVYERAPETGRLHFHALMYIPHGEMVGEITEKQDYSTKFHKMQTTYCNDFFFKSFGRNDFKEIKTAEMKSGMVLDYITKYLSKTDERIVYSRGIKTEICMSISTKDIACQFLDFVTKFVFYDDVIDSERDIMHYNYQQMNVF